MTILGWPILLWLLGLLVRRFGNVLASVDVETESVSCTCFRERALDCTVHVSTPDGLVGDGLVPLIHHGQILDVLDTLDGDTGLNPACSPVGEVIPAFRTFVDGVGGRWVMLFDHLPCPRPGEIGEIPFLLRMLIAVDCVERCKDALFLHLIGI